MTVHEKCVRYWERLYPGVKQPQTYFKEWYAAAAQPGGRVLDAGCSDGGSINHIEEAPEMESVGMDVDFEALKRNTSVKHKVVASADALPFRDGVFDIVSSQYVIEHLPDPARSFAEFSRAGKPGSTFVYITTNSTGFPGALLKNIPRPLQGVFKRAILKMEEDEIYPVYMRGNTKALLKTNLAAAGYKNPDFIFIGGPFYFSFSFALFKLAVAMEKLTDGKLRHLKLYIVGKAENRRD